MAPNLALLGLTQRNLIRGMTLDQKFKTCEMAEQPSCSILVIQGLWTAIPSGR
jgi:hypothetical protein